ncbi:PREDICTED: uncharacterized protein LOC106746589 isoform X2 [Dinoponera quadriceps]|uniref:Uncharacterized protein LOC106746589 isoform X2 n=1 Tax=Dinoponera quadriceps TaxID=609295 RepID=A0A6P3XK39_DINQU|nr:PREDICTED: uncharacterized protein LOC106746589 isoform X2 [Dinoponera quadriceps]XP_014478821.1 PREDICTED: uncharacterized protein LOC106746589 isoform X2 [Dinoponera quadriceps]
MYILLVQFNLTRTKAPDLRNRSVMRENHFHEEAVFRGGKKALNDERGFTATLIKIQKGGLRLRRWLIGLLIFLLMSLVVINSYNTGQFRIVRFGAMAQSKENSHEDYVQLKPIYPSPIGNGGFLVRNKGCRIPAMDPFDPAIKRFITKEEPLVCDHGNLPLIDSNNTALFVNPLAWNEFYNKSKGISCCWRSFWRTKDQDNAVTYDKECHPFKDSCTVSAEFVKVECSRNSKMIYKDYFAFLPRKPSVEDRCKQTFNKMDTENDRLSILVIGLDSVSRLNFHRMMPMTVKALQSLGAVEMLGYTKVADNTYPNLVPVLSGLSAGELLNLCWQKPEKTFDDCPLLWKKYSAAGYRTIFAEDACSMTTFNYLKPGFREPPTDYYLRPYCIGAEHDIGNSNKLNANLCLGARKNFDCLLQYARKAAVEFATEPYFAFIWQASLTHDYFTYPQLGDSSYRDFVEHVSQQGLLNRTVLVMMSDHGMRWGEFRQTYQGKTEDRLPFVFIVLPKWWREKYPLAWGNLRRNSRSLTTPFDLHETLTDFVNPHVVHETFLKKRIKIQAASPVPRGISWFLPVPEHRTCEMAQISSHWCMCHSSSNISLNDTGLQDSVAFLVGELNGMLSKYPPCAILNLKDIKDAKLWLDKSNGTTLMDYTVTIQTTPGDAVFEGSIRYRTEDNSRKLVGSISRLNAYGKQSACVDEFNMRLYCYCL